MRRPPRPTAESDLSATYYDTADLRLLRSRMTLRRRRGGSDAGWHLKLPAGADSRDEVRHPLGRYRKPPPRWSRSAAPPTGTRRCSRSSSSTRSARSGR